MAQGAIVMISLVLAYWDRQVAANNALALLNQAYRRNDMLEVIVVDDGSPVPFVPPPTELYLRVVRLPTKDHPASPCVTWNRGVEAARGGIIALSCVEILHRQPVLWRLAAGLHDGYDYVSPAVWCPSKNRWHAHSSLGRPPLNFLTVMRRSLFEAVEGFDEEYREGFAYEDADFVKKLEAAGAKYLIRDDLVVEHPREGAKTQYTPEQHARNRKIFEAKWGVSK